MAYDIWNKRASSRNWAIGASPLLTMPKAKLPSFPSSTQKQSVASPSVPSFLWLNLATVGITYAGFLWLTQNKKKL